MYTYSELSSDLSRLDLKVGSIGKSLYGNEIYYVHAGSNSGKQIIVTGAIHARENVTALAVMRQIRALIGKTIPIGVYFLPMLNPDGAELIQKGASASKEYGEFVRKINGSDDFSLWKANGRAVDLNLNFDAKFGQGKGNKFSPSPHGYVGAHAFSEPETRALRNFTLKVSPVFTVSYHALGREVYWYFGQKTDADRIHAQKIADFLGYKLVDGDLSSAGGYKDWCVMRGIPAVTIEIGDEKLSHPIVESDLAEDLEINERLISLLSDPSFYL